MLYVNMLMGLPQFRVCKKNPLFHYFIVLYLLFSNILVIKCLEENILVKFQNNGCLQGNVEMEKGNLIFIQHEDDLLKKTGQTILLNALGEDFESLSEINSILNITSKTVINEAKRNFQTSPTMLINELANYNDIEMKFNLIAEYGPSHDKVFNIQLQLGNENYEGLGKSLKIAKKIVSSKALRQTKYNHPPLKNIESQLYKIAKDRNEDVLFLNEYGQLISDSKEVQSPIFYPINGIKNHLNETRVTNINGSDYMSLKEKENNQYEPLMVLLKVGNREYFGLGYTINSARNDAAIKALEEIKRLNSEEEFWNGQDGDFATVTQETKHPTNLLFEMASKLDKRLVFSVVKEEGPAHSKIFTTRCQVDELVTEAEGKSKKTSRKLASELMLNKFHKLGWLYSDNKVLKKKRSTRKKKDKVINKEKVIIKTEIPQEIYIREPTLLKEKEIMRAKLTKKTTNKRPIKDELLELAKKLGINIQFWNIPKNNHEKFLTFVSLDLTPPEVCFGIDQILETSRDIASLRAIELLEKYGIDNVYNEFHPKNKDAIYSQFPMDQEEENFEYFQESKLK